MSQKHPAELSISNFNYHLPETKIARYPLAERDQSKLLVYQSGNISESTYQHLHQALPENAMLVFNNTKVVEARLKFQKPTGGIIELFCLEPDDRYPDITTAMLETGKVFWKCLVGGAKKWKEGSLFYTAYNGDEKITVEAKKAAQYSNHCLIEFTWNDLTLPFAALLHIAGCIPLPPYLNRNAEASDKDRYQTIYAQHDGSVAAPTAGLHFTQAVFNALALKNISTHFVTLHVGAGTFKPVTAASMKDHEMHAEYINVLPALISALILQLDHGIIAVGTTSMRTLESLYWMGVKTFIQPNLPQQQITLSQWEAYDLSEKNIEPKTALNALLNWMKQNQLEQLITKTQIIIAPGYNFKITKGLITNFHQPQSTLLLLIAAIVGDDWKKIYAYALENNFRFLSYGDGSLIWNKAFK